MTLDLVSNCERH